MNFTVTENRTVGANVFSYLEMSSYRGMNWFLFSSASYTRDEEEREWPNRVKHDLRGQKCQLRTMCDLIGIQSVCALPERCLISFFSHPTPPTPTILSYTKTDFILPKIGCDRNTKLHSSHSEQLERIRRVEVGSGVKNVTSKTNNNVGIIRKEPRKVSPPPFPPMISNLIWDCGLRGTHR